MDNFKLRPYQEQTVSHSVNMLNERGNSLVVAGTGAGKTIMLSAAIGKFFKGFQASRRRKPHVLVLVHRTEIHGQNHSKFSRVCPEIPTSEITSVRKSLKGNVHFGMVQTVAGLLDDFTAANSYFDLIVIDEAHHAKASTYENIIEWNAKGKPNAALLGVTATPNRGDKLPLIHLFDNYSRITTKYLIASHYLVRPTFIDMAPIFETKDGIEKGKLSKNCKLDSAGITLINTLCNNYLQQKAPGKSVIFAPNHDFCAVVFDALKAKGRNPAYLFNGIDEMTRKSEIARFENGDAEELINVDICTEGYDYPDLRNVVDFDTNGTHGQWVQKIGRGLRTAPGKTGCNIIDFGGNIDRYPQGVDADVDLNGIVKNPAGKKLTERDLFETEEKVTAFYILTDSSEYTPYHPPTGFETVNDPDDNSIAFVACGAERDCIIAGGGEDYRVYIGDKGSMTWVGTGTFSDCIGIGLEWMGELPEPPDEPITGTQIRMLAPEYPTTALNRYGANCCLCWKAWKGVINGT